MTMTTRPQTAELSPSVRGREPEADVEPMFLERWSRRAFSSRPLSRASLATLFEAARWAPSSGNEQPWLFVYAHEPQDLARLRELLVPGNRVWADRAPVLALLFARRASSHGPNRWAPFDAGAAWMALALQAHQLGLSAHAMGGFYEEKAYAALGVPESEYQAMAAIAIGYPGDPAGLPEAVRARERPSGRRAIAQIAVEGRWGGDEGGVAERS